MPCFCAVRGSFNDGSAEILRRDESELRWQPGQLASELAFKAIHPSLDPSQPAKKRLVHIFKLIQWEMSDRDKGIHMASPGGPPIGNDALRMGELADHVRCDGDLSGDFRIEINVLARAFESHD